MSLGLTNYNLAMNNLMEAENDMSDNLKLWNAVQETNPADTKAVSFGRKFTAIDAYSQIKKATEQFGEYGATWGIKNIEHTFVPNSNMVLAVGEFHTPNGVSIVSSSIFYISDKGKADDDFAKKLETDMITKALSRLGFNADVFMGKFDDNKYVQGMTDKFSAAKVELINADQVTVINDMLKESGADLATFLKIGKVSSVEEIKATMYHKAVALLEKKIHDNKGEEK
jgi:hypothetical protein